MIKLWNPEGAGDRPGPAVSDAEFVAKLEKLHAERLRRLIATRTRTTGPT